MKNSLNLILEVWCSGGSLKGKEKISSDLIKSDCYFNEKWTMIKNKFYFNLKSVIVLTQFLLTFQGIF